MKLDSFDIVGPNPIRVSILTITLAIYLRKAAISSAPTSIRKVLQVLEYAHRPGKECPVFLIFRRTFHRFAKSNVA